MELNRKLAKVNELIERIKNNNSETARIQRLELELSRTRAENRMYEKMFENSPQSAAISKAIDREVASMIKSAVALGFEEVASIQSAPTVDELKTKMENNSEP